MFAAKNELFTRPSGYQISRSVRLRSSASAYFNRTQTAGSQTTWTWSGWVKRGKLGTSQYLMQAGGSSGSGVTMSVIADDFQIETGNGTTQYYARSTAQYRDPSAWYHVVMVCNTTSATSTLTGTPSDRLQIWINGVQVTSFSASSIPTQNFAGYINQNTVAANIGRWNGATPNYYFDGYLTEVNFIDGQALTPTSFGQFNSVTGVWQPLKYTGTYGTNGFYLNFSDNSAATATTIGKDYSGNGNNWTPNNISVTSGVTYDSMIDVPTNYADGGNGRGNYAVLNPLSSTYAFSLSEGNLKATLNGANSSTVGSSIAVSSGKWYAEMTIGSTNAGARTYPLFGICNPKTFGNPDFLGDGADEYSYSCDGYKTNNNTATSVGTTLTTNDVMMIAFDADSGKLWWGKNGTWIASGDPANGANAMYSSIPSSTYVFAICGYSSTNAFINFGQRPFAYTPPSGFNALNTQNLPAPTISNGALYMAATLWTGTGASQSINNSVNGVSFQPDMVWNKSRSNADFHNVFDSVRGGIARLVTNSTSAESSTGNGFAGITSTGFNLDSSGGGGDNNASGRTYVGWQWKAGGTPATTNTSGSITSTVSVNATAGFSVATFTAPASNQSFTVGHGLGVAPQLTIVKRRDSATGGDWWTWHIGLGDNTSSYLALNQTAAVATAANAWGTVGRNSTVCGFNAPTTIIANGTYVMYNWSAVRGYSAFGSYTGNGSTDGPFVFLGFRPRFIMTKRTDTTSPWQIIDTSRDTYNSGISGLFPNTSGAEASFTQPNGIDFLSNGFKLRNSSADDNASGGTYVYAAFAENPYKLALAR